MVPRGAGLASSGKMDIEQPLAVDSLRSVLAIFPVPRRLQSLPTAAGADQSGQEQTAGKATIPPRAFTAVVGDHCGLLAWRGWK